MIINLNQNCRVVLTDFGARHYNYWHAFLGKNAPPDKKEGDVLETELWGLMQIFGETMYNGMPKIPFVDNNIKIINS